jgi:hypothetical protein
MEQKKRGGLIIWIIVAIATWFAYDTFFAKNWTVNYTPIGGNWWTIDAQSPKFHDQAECAAYAASMTTMSNTFRFNCGYKCKVGGATGLTCKKYL